MCTFKVSKKSNVLNLQFKFCRRRPLPHKIIGALRIFRPHLDLFLCTPLQRIKFQGRQYVHTSISLYFFTTVNNKQVIKRQYSGLKKRYFTLVIVIFNEFQVIFTDSFVVGYPVYEGQVEGKLRTIYFIYFPRKKNIFFTNQIRR